MRKVKRNYLLKLISLLLIGLFTINAGRASQPTPPVTVLINYRDMEPKTIGEQILIPIEIKLDRSLKWESATFELKVLAPSQEGVSAESVHMVIPENYDVTQQPPLITYIPVTITGEGLFNVVGSLHIKFLNEGRASMFFNDLQYTELLEFGFFAFKGKYILGSSSGNSFHKMARYNVLQNNKRIRELVEELIKSLEVGESSLSMKDEDDIYTSIRDEKNNISQEYFKKYPQLN